MLSSLAATDNSGDHHQFCLLSGELGLSIPSYSYYYDYNQYDYNNYNNNNNNNNYDYDHDLNYQSIIHIFNSS